MLRPGRPSAPRVRVRARSILGIVALGAVLFGGCGGSSKVVEGDDGGAGEGAAPSGGATAAGGTAGVAGTSGTGTGGTSGTSTGGSAGEPPDTDPGCPDIPAPPGRYECDVFGSPSGCESGEGCYPTIEHPFGTGCDQQVHGSRCAYAGTGVQGEFCPGGTLDCAPGFICIVGAQSGSRCMRMCAIDGSMPCPSGLFCGETDAFGVGVCA
ncbi:MAG TPA: hypothetical protein VFZ53_10520 [Polyangiaceae bacterium]